MKPRVWKEKLLFWKKTGKICTKPWYKLNQQENLLFVYLKAKQHLKAEQLEQELAEGKKAEVVDDADSGDEDKYADRIDMPGQKFDTKRSVLFLSFENFKVCGKLKSSYYISAN